MKKRIVKLTESDLEKLVQKILKEDDDVTTGKNPFKSTGDETITLDFIKEYIIEAIEYHDEGYDESMAEGVDALSRMIMGNIKDDISYVSENYEGEIDAIVMDDWRDWFMSHKYLREEMASSEENTGDENQDNPKDVKEFLMAMKKYFMDKYPRFGKRINTRNEKVLVLAALAQQLGVDPNMISQAKGELKNLGL